MEEAMELEYELFSFNEGQHWRNVTWKAYIKASWNGLFHIKRKRSFIHVLQLNDLMRNSGENVSADIKYSTFRITETII